MPGISAADVKALRERTGLPMMDCKKALSESGGNVEKAIELLRKAGAKLMEKRAGSGDHRRTNRRLYRPRGERRRHDRSAMRERPGGLERALSAIGQ